MALEAQTVIDWITRLPPAGVYVFLAVSSVIENVFPPGQEIRSRSLGAS